MTPQHLLPSGRGDRGDSRFRRGDDFCLGKSLGTDILSASLLSLLSGKGAAFFPVTNFLLNTGLELKGIFSQGTYLLSFGLIRAGEMRRRNLTNKSVYRG